MRDRSRHAPRLAGMAALALATLTLAAIGGCVQTVISGEDPNVQRPTATGDSKRDQLVINVPWMEPPVPELLLDNKAVLVEHVRGLTSDNKFRYMLRSRGTGVTALVLISIDIPTPDVMDFVYEVQSLPSGYALDLPIGVGDVGRRGPITLAVNGVPLKLAPSTDVAVVMLARDEKTRIRATRVKPMVAEPTPAAAPKS